MENPIKLDDFGGTIIFGNTHMLAGKWTMKDWLMFKNTLPKTNMDNYQNDGLEKVTGPFRNCNCWYQFVRFLGCILCLFFRFELRNFEGYRS